jgi:hypothetical protein
MATKRYDEDIPEGHAFAETRDLKPRDRYLRSHGFRIVSRPKSGEAIWVRGNREMTESEAVRACDLAIATTGEA